MFSSRGRRSAEEESMLSPHEAMRKQPESVPLYAPRAHQYGAKEAYLIEEITASRSWWRTLTFGWLIPLLELGNSRQLTDRDVFSLSDDHETAQLAEQVEAAWAFERHKKERGASLVVALVRCFGLRLLAVVGFQVAHDVASIAVPPLVLHAIVEYALDRDASAVLPICNTLLLMLSGVAVAVVRHQGEYLRVDVSVRVQSSLAALAFRHLLVVSPSILQRTATEQLVGYVTDDAEATGKGAITVSRTVGAAFQIAIGGWMLWSLVGSALWVGVIVLVVAAPLVGYVTKCVTSSQSPVRETRAECLKSTRGLFSSIKAVKLLAWERCFVARAVELRDAELRMTRSLYFALGCRSALYNLILAVVCIGILLGCIKVAGIAPVIPRTLAILLLLILLLSGPISRAPDHVVDLATCYSAVRRLNKFLAEAERSWSRSRSGISGVGVVIKNADFKWDSALQEKTELDLLLEAQGIAMETGAAPVLHHINFYAEPGKIHAIVGAPESGKSTFLGGIIGLVRCCAGEVNVYGNVAFINREPFLINASIRENVCFGLPFDEERYHYAVSASCLKDDLRAFPHGDQTKAGSSNVYLACAQRVRIALARIIYQDADVYVIDDILSTMDDGISSMIFKKCFRRALQKKVVIMATNSLRFLKQCDNVVVLSRGTVVEAGSFQNLMANKKWGILAELMRAQGKKTVPEPDVEAALRSCDNTEERNDPDDDSHGAETNALTVNVVDGGDMAADTEDGAAEENIRLAVGLWLARSSGGGGYGLCILLFLLVLATSLCRLCALQWTTKLGSGELTIQGLAVLGIFYVLLHTTSSALLYNRSLHASHDIFQGLVDRLAHVPLVFFDSTPHIRLLNYISKDILAIDAGFTDAWLPLFSSTTHLLLSSCLLIALSPWLIIVLGSVVVGLIRVSELQAKPARDLERIKRNSRPRIEDCIAEVLGGMTTIRLHKADHMYVPQIQHYIEKHRQAAVLRACADAWLGMRVDAMLASLAGGVCLMAVHLHQSTEAAEAAGKIGVALFIVVTLPSIVSELSTAWENMRSVLVAGERIKAHSKMPTEAAYDSMPELRPREDWPVAGAVEFDNVSLRYREGLPRVLRGVSLSIDAGDRVAVIGKTGSGKHTLFNAITRLVELTTGSISIDGVDISKIGLHDLRSKIAVLWAEPMLIAGTIRMNLDPMYRHSDNELWSVLKKVHLKGVVLSLDEIVEEGGGNYSCGERHLLVIARTIVQRPKILLVEESELVASEDIPEAQLIMKCLRQEFQGCTTIIITQQTATTMDATRVVIMDNGQITETGLTRELHKNYKSIYRMILEDWKRRDHARPLKKA